jgi:hypothetical protein
MPNLHDSSTAILLSLTSCFEQYARADAQFTLCVSLQEVGYKRLSLTDLTVKLQRGARNGTCKKAWEEAAVEAAWEATAWGKKIAARKRKATISDFQRFKDMKAKQVIYLLHLLSLFAADIVLLSGQVNTCMVFSTVLNF